MEYRISKSWRIFAFLLSLLLVGLGIAAIVNPSFTGGKEPAAIMSMGGMVILFGIFTFLDIIRTRVIIDETHINVQRAFTNRTMQLADILGYSLGEKNRILLHSKTRGVKTITLPQYLEHYDALRSWLIENYPNKDEVQREAETQEILANETFGITKDERAFKLQRAKLVSRVVNIIGIIAIAWAFFYNKPYDEGMFVLLGLPLVGIFIIWQFKGLIRFDSTKKSAYPSLNTFFLLTILSLALRVMIDFDLYELDRFWTLFIIGSLILTLLCINICRDALKEIKQKALVMVLIFAACAAYCYPAIVFTNYYFDHSEAQQFTVAVKSKHVNRSKTTTYYLGLEPWGRFKKEKDVSVPSSVYNEVQVEDSVFIRLYKGRWGVPWFVLIR